VLKIKLTAAVTLANNVGLLMWAACRSAGKFWLMSPITLWIFASVALSRFALYWSSLKQIQIFTSFCRNILNSCRLGGTDLLPRFQSRNQTGDIQRHLREQRQVS